MRSRVKIDARLCCISPWSYYIGIPSISGYSFKYTRSPPFVNKLYADSKYLSKYGKNTIEWDKRTVFKKQRNVSLMSGNI